MEKGRGEREREGEEKHQIQKAPCIQLIKVKGASKANGIRKSNHQTTARGLL